MTDELRLKLAREQLDLVFGDWIPDDPDPDAMTSDDWYTPPELVDLIEDWLGGIDLDPCWSPRSYVRPRVGLTQADNGLAHRWSGRVRDVDVRTRFVNPPYSTPGPFVAALDTLHHGIPEPGWAAVDPGHSLLLVRIDTSTWWWRLIWDADAICWLYARVPFSRPGRKARSQPRDHHALVYWGSSAHTFRDAFGFLGHCTFRQAFCPGDDEVTEEIVRVLVARGLVRPVVDDDGNVRYTPSDDAPEPRDHERSGGHRLVAIDGIPAETYPFLPLIGALRGPGSSVEDLDAMDPVDPNADTAVISTREGLLCEAHQWGEDVERTDDPGIGLVTCLVCGHQAELQL